MTQFFLVPLSVDLVSDRGSQLNLGVFLKFCESLHLCENFVFIVAWIFQFRLSRRLTVLVHVKGLIYKDRLLLT